jgi:hypothetical protein
MGISGNLRTMELAELLQWLSSSLKTGTLLVDNGKTEKQIVFRDGRLISSSSSDPREHLGSFLVSHGFVSEQELAEAVQMQQSNKMLLGKILLTIGAVGEDDLQRMLRLKAEESLYDIFAWTEGDFHFVDGQMPPPETLVPLSLDVAGVVLEGMQRLDEWRRIRAVLPSLECIPVAIGELDDSELGEFDSQVLGLLDDDRTVAEICRQSHASEFQVCRILFRQHLAGRIKIVRPRRGPASPGAPPPPSAAFSAEQLIARARELLDAKQLEGALRHARAAKALDPENRKIAIESSKIEDEIRRSVEQAGLRSQDIPELARPLEELAKQQLSPQEGFLLSRLDGRQPVSSLVKLGPLPPLDMQLLFLRLLEQGHLKIRAKKA